MPNTISRPHWVSIPGDVVKPATDERAPVAIPESEDLALNNAFRANKELKRLESGYQAKNLEIKSNQAQRLPRVDLVAQYALFAKYSNFDQYFNRFKYNNAQFGASVQIPLLVGSGVKAQISQNEAEQKHIRAEIQAARSRIALEVHQSYQEIESGDGPAWLRKRNLIWRMSSSRWCWHR